MSDHTGILVLVRHGQSEWNATGKWTGWTDIPLSETGEKEARDVGQKLTDIHFDFGFTSVLQRAQQTMEAIQHVLQQPFAVTASEKLNERNYGVYTGKNKWEIKEKIGEEEFMKLRRSWDYPIEKGESLKQVYERVIPYYKGEVLPLLEKGQHILIAAHGNSLRALIKYLENIPDDKISSVELATGEALVYEISPEGKIVSKKSIKTSGTVS
ncbi:MAG: 2,3-diphosphoglycerate-dependent phosphoglycerate mutase [Candidatus Levybacteria bacterium]|nr:2,3-diphosphoglycerate-dependent phosphoglycerate mutase [Candidatus Levybacteria bacterium]